MLREMEHKLVFTVWKKMTNDTNTFISDKYAQLVYRI